jgi:hypothetical protein
MGVDFAGPWVPSPGEAEDLLFKNSEDCWSFFDKLEDWTRTGPSDKEGRLSSKLSASAAAGPAMLAHTFLNAPMGTSLKEDLRNPKKLNNNFLRKCTLTKKEKTVQLIQEVHLLIADREL